MRGFSRLMIHVTVTTIVLVLVLVSAKEAFYLERRQLIQIYGQCKVDEHTTHSLYQVDGAISRNFISFV